MKKVNVIIIAAMVAALGFFTSCGEDVDPIGPEITFQNYDGSDIILNSGEELNFSFVVKQGDEKIQDVVVTLGQGQVNEPIYTASVDAEKIQDGMLVEINELMEVPGTYTVTITVTDKGSLEFVKTVNVIVESPISEYTTTLLYAPLASGLQKCALATSTGATYTQSEAKDNSSLVDILYAVGGATTGAQLSCPADANASSSDVYTNAYGDVSSWTTKNFTQYATTTATFASVTTVQDLAATFTSGTEASDGAGMYTNGRIDNLSEGQVIAFMTADEKYGLIEIVEIVTETVGGGTGDYIKINVKVQK
ncbi:MAG TPA: hypothetical protein PK734_00720 [Bacteroidales bacterium]|nr:hypothetical protein [Bacteroidales bacterium]HPM11993.1 hypothetical protein [Bacteroidales bacterium]